MRKRTSSKKGGDTCDMKWMDVTQDDLDSALASLKTGHDPEAARNLIEYFHERMSNGFQYDDRILRDLVAHALQGLSLGKPLTRHLA